MAALPYQNCNNDLRAVASLVVLPGVATCATIKLVTPPAHRCEILCLFAAGPMGGPEGGSIPLLMVRLCAEADAIDIAYMPRSRNFWLVLYTAYKG